MFCKCLVKCFVSVWLGVLSSVWSISVLPYKELVFGSHLHVKLASKKRLKNTSFVGVLFGL